MMTGENGDESRFVNSATVSMGQHDFVGDQIEQISRKTRRHRRVEK